MQEKYMNPKDYGLPYDSLREGQVKAIEWLVIEN